jgi:nitroreductase
MSKNINEHPMSNEETNIINIDKHSDYLPEFIYKRRSIRKYQEKGISKEYIEKLIEAASWAPSACNKQAWKFIVIDNKEKIEALTSKGAASFLKNTNNAILVLYDNRTDNIEYQDHIQSASAAIQNMLLMATSLDIAACWVCNLPPKAFLRDQFSIPKYYDPIALISIGWPESNKRPVRKRKFSVDELISYNNYNFSSDNFTSKSKIRLLIRRIARKIYYSLPKNNFLRKYAKKY